MTLNGNTEIIKENIHRLNHKILAIVLGFHEKFKVF